MPTAARRAREGVARYGFEIESKFNVNDVVVINGGRFSQGLLTAVLHPAVIKDVISISGCAHRYVIQYLVDDSFDEVDSLSLRQNDASLNPSIFYITPSDSILRGFARLTLCSFCSNVLSHGRFLRCKCSTGIYCNFFCWNRHILTHGEQCKMIYKKDRRADYNSNFWRNVTKKRKLSHKTELHNIARAHDIDDFDEKEYMEFGQDGDMVLQDCHSSYCGDLTGECRFCGALFFEGEVNSTGKFTTCCSLGKIDIPSTRAPPSDFVEALFRGASEYSPIFRAKSSLFNSTVSLAKVHMHTVYLPPGVPTVRITNSVYSTFPTFPLENSTGIIDNCLFHIFFDSGLAGLSIPSMEKELLERLMKEVFIHNPYVREIKTILDSVDWDDLPLYKLVFSTDPPTHIHKGCVNAPDDRTGVGILMDTNTDVKSHRQIQVTFNDGSSQVIRSTNQFYDPYNYILYFLGGDWGWDYRMVCNGHRVTAREYYCYRGHFRDRSVPGSKIQHDVLFYGGQLSLRYWVDMYAKVEENALNWIKYNQATIKADLYKVDQLDNTNEEMQKIILPSSFTGSPRYFVTHFQDAMAIVHHYGKPTLFITFTANPSWPEISKNLKPGQSAWERPDLIDRVFHMKLRMLLEDLRKKKVLGNVTAYMHVIEFQKRGLPHAHILAFLSEEDIPQSAESFDKISCAELPDPTTNPRLYSIVTSNMVHHHHPGCLNDGDDRCSKQYPKDINEFTYSDNDNDFYPNLRRREIKDLIPGVRSKKFLWRGTLIDNTWIVPYNPYLTLKYDAHINVEICVSSEAVKYLYKYVYKGPDVVSWDLAPGSERPTVMDEAAQYKTARFLTAPESMWRIFGYSLDARYPPVERLEIHDESRADENTALTAFFERVQFEIFHPLSDRELGKTSSGAVKPRASELTYDRFPAYYVLKKDPSSGKLVWNRRIREQYEDKVGRMFMRKGINDSYYYRLLLLYQKGPTCFADLRTVNGIVYDDPKTACFQLNVFDDPRYLESLFEEMSLYASERQLRISFCDVLLNIEHIRSPLQLWLRFKKEFSRDFQRKRLRSKHGRSTNADDKRHVFLQEDYDKALHHINVELQRVNPSKGAAFFGLPEIAVINEDFIDSVVIDIDAFRDEVIHNVACMNDDQLGFYNMIREKIQNPPTSKTDYNGNIVFLDGPAGTGKSFVFNTIIKTIIVEEKPFAIASATSGIAATVLFNGRTSHNTYGIPFKVYDGTEKCSLRPDGEKAMRLKEATLLLWDEVPMADKNVVTVVDNFLRELMNEPNYPFGGKIVIFGGDWRQVLPVKQRAQRGTIVDSILKRSSLWSKVDVFHLTINERARQRGIDAEYAEFVLSVGNGNCLTYDEHLTTNNTRDPEMIRLPEDIVFAYDSIITERDNLLRLVEYIYPHLKELSIADQNVCILTPKNSVVDRINEIAIKEKIGSEHVFYSADSSENTVYAPEFLNKLTPSGVPPHRLILKVGAPVMLLRNIAPHRGLCNGTRLIVKEIHTKFVKCEIITGPRKGEHENIFRITFIPDDMAIGFQMRRVQLPLRLCFAMTVNKSQGQTLSSVGIYLPEPVFGHGQLYVALSRCGCRMSTKIMVKNLKHRQGEFDISVNGSSISGVFTRNVVYREVL